MQKAYKKIIERVDKIESEYGSLEDYVRLLTISESKHMMKMRDFSHIQVGKAQDFFDFRENKTLSRELHELELADLWDLKRQSGEFDGEYF